MSSASPRPPVVVLVLDEFPTATMIDANGNIAGSRFPNFARLSREATWYPNHTTVSTHTFRSVPAMLSGSPAPDLNTYPVLSEYPQNLFTWMRDQGYRIDARESATQICPQAVCPLPAAEVLNPAEYQVAFDFLKAKTFLNRSRARTGHLGWARQLKLAAGSFSFRHFLVPHRPYTRLPSGQQYKVGPMPEISQPDYPVINSPIGNVRLSYQRLMLQIGYVDRLIGEIRSRAIRQGKWKSMMLVVVGDHGMEHHPGRSQRGIQPENLGTIAFTPLFVKYPGTLRGGKSQLATKGIDVLPTIAGQLGRELPGTTGQPIPDLDHEPRPVWVDFQTFPFDQALRSRKQAVAYRDQLLGKRGLFKLGPVPHLIGRAAGRTRKGRAGAFLDQPRSLRSVRNRSSKVPALITGRAPGVRPGGFVAVSVNGVVRGTAQVFTHQKVRRFGAMVNPRWFRSANRIGIHRVTGGRLGKQIG